MNHEKVTYTLLPSHPPHPHLPQMTNGKPGVGSLFSHNIIMFSVIKITLSPEERNISIKLFKNCFNVLTISMIYCLRCVCMDLLCSFILGSIVRFYHLKQNTISYEFYMGVIYIYILICHVKHDRSSVKNMMDDDV